MARMLDVLMARGGVINKFPEKTKITMNWVVVSNIFYVHRKLRNDPI